MYSLWVKPHFKHRRNCVEDSSEPRVCTCQTLAVLFPQFGHSILMVGKVVSSCSSFPMMATNCLGLCSIYLPFNLLVTSNPRVFCPHFVQDIIINTCFPEFTLIGFSREPHSSQNSILLHLHFFSALGFLISCAVIANNASWIIKNNVIVAALLQQVCDRSPTGV